MLILLGFFAVALSLSPHTPSHGKETPHYKSGDMVVIQELLPEREKPIYWVMEILDEEKGEMVFILSKNSFPTLRQAKQSVSKDQGIGTEYFDYSLLHMTTKEIQKYVVSEVHTPEPMASVQ